MTESLTKRIPFVRSCLQECDQPIDTLISGSVPIWLKGTLLRNGPGLQTLGSDKFNHIFDGLALIHRFHIENGSVTYQNKFLRSDSYNRDTKANRIVVSEFGTRAFPDPCKTIWQRFMSYFWPEMTDNDSVNIYPVADQLYAATETKFIRRVDPNSLETGEKVDLSKLVAVNMATAHPHIDSNGDVYNMGSSFGSASKYQLIKIPNTENAFQESSIIASIKMERPFYPSYYHSFSMTEKYLVFIEQPLVISVPTLALSPITGYSYGDSLVWRPKLMTRFHVIRRKDGKVLDTKYIGEPFAFFHTINAFEDRNQIVVDICCYSDGKVISAFTEKHFKDVLQNDGKFEAISDVRRFVLPLMEFFPNAINGQNMVDLDYTKAKAFSNASDGAVMLEAEHLTPSGPAMGELPRINYNYNGRKYRYFYSISQNENLRTKLMKFDTVTKQTIFWQEDDAIPSEPVFIERPDNCESGDQPHDEDNGVVLSSVLSESDERQGFLLILEAKTFKELARARFQTQSSIPGTFHGLFVH